MYLLVFKRKQNKQTMLIAKDQLIAQNLNIDWDVVKKTVTAECEDYFGDFASFKCAYCFSQDRPHPCNVLDEYKDLYYKANETVKKEIIPGFSQINLNIPLSLSL